MMERLALLVLVAAAAGAQEPAPPAEEDPNVLLALALRRLQTAENLVAKVDVKHEPAEQPGAGGQGGPGAIVIVQARIMGAEEPYEGPVEAWRAADGTVVLLSGKELPGFAIYVGESRSIERTTFEEARFSLAQLKTELGALLDMKAFAQRIFDAKLEPARDAATGEITFKGKVEKEIVPPAEGEMAFLTEGRVLGAEATLVVQADGRLKSAAVKITRNDPNQELMRGGGKIVLGPGGAPPRGKDKRHDIPGGSTTYTLSFEEAPPSDRAKAFRAEIERLLGAASASGK